MDKSKIRNFAVNARERLLTGVRQRLASLGIDDQGVKAELEISTANVKYYTNENFPVQGAEIEQRNQVVQHLQRMHQENDDWQAVLADFIEEVAYTWFNRIIALRFMEVNDYLPSRVRVLSSEEGWVEPDIINHALEIEDDLGGFTPDEREQISHAQLTKNPRELDTVYTMLFIKQTDALADILPGLFEKTAAYLKLLFTPKYNDGVIKALITEIPEADFDVEQSGQVEIIGWMYQYYISDHHDQVVNITGKKAVKKQDIPAATQLFTTDWVVRYMVENSLGKYYLERNADSKLADEFEYLLPDELENIDEKKELESYHVIDNAMGSGHILVYAFDVLMQMYQEKGYSTRSAAHAILQKNLYGLEIDKRAYQLAYFALMMKGRQYDRRFFRRNIVPNIFCFEDVDLPDEFYGQIPKSMATELKSVFSDFANAKEFGSIIDLKKQVNIEELIATVEEVQIADGLDLYGMQAAKNLALKTLQMIRVMMAKYEVVVTNPPYLNKFDQDFKKYLKEHYKEYSKDLFSVFIAHNMQMLVNDGYAGFMTPFVWMFIKTYEPLRTRIFNQAKIDSLIQMEYSAFEEATVPINTFVIKNTRSDLVGTYVRLSDFKGGMEVQRQKVLEAIAQGTGCSYVYRTPQSNFIKIPGSPVAYWASASLIKDFEEGTPLGEIADANQGLITGDNNQFLRYWHEVDFNRIKFDAQSTEDAKNSGKKWFPINKGGAYRKWYGNYDYVVNWENDGDEIKHFTDARGKLRSRPQNTDRYFKEAVTWSKVTSGDFSMRLRQYGSIHDNAGMSIFSNNEERLKLLLALGNSKVMAQTVTVLNPTINYQIGDIVRIPVLNVPDEVKASILANVDQAINLTKKDWDRDETSWNFQKHFLMNCESLSESYTAWLEQLIDDARSLRQIEAKNNAIFSEIYQIKVDDQEDKLSILDPQADNNDIYAIKSLLSYFIGCIFGRYSLDVDGLAYAGGDWDPTKYQMFTPNEDNIILLTDRRVFNDQRDIIVRLREFLTAAFGADHLADNLHFIAETLAPQKIAKGTPVEQVIRDYFSKEFYKDHVQMYSKRPIYWQFSSGRSDGFKALMYLHRYDHDELAMARDYLHQLQEAYNTLISFNAEQEKVAATAKEKNNLSNDTKKLNKMIDEMIKYDAALQHQALAQIDLDLDDGVVVNHAKLQGDEKLLTKF